MKLNNVKVIGLFNQFNHEISLDSEEGITIMIGPNGYGKTMILKILDSFFNSPLSSMAYFPFDKLSLSFDSGVKLHITINKVKNVENNYNKELIPLNEIHVDYIQPNKEVVSFNSPGYIDPDDLGFPINIIEDIIPELDEIGPARWRIKGSNRILNLPEVLAEYGDQLPITDNQFTETPSWLNNIKNSIQVRNIGTERLTKSYMKSNPSRARRTNYEYRPEWGRAPGVASRDYAGRTVRRYAEELGDRIRKTLTEYGQLSQSLDRTFPARLVEDPVDKNLDLDNLRSQLQDIENRRKELIKTGLLAEEQELWRVKEPTLDNVDESRLGVLTVYARDAKQKLDVFNELYLRVNTLKKILNSRFLYKEVRIGLDGIFVVNESGKKLALESLSSGEQHELVLLYDLLFNVPDNALIMIDEPELSLHVDWQDRFLDDLEEVVKLSKFHVLLATHSPQIIGGRWYLTKELTGPSPK